MRKKIYLLSTLTVLLLTSCSVINFGNKKEEHPSFSELSTKEAYSFLDRAISNTSSYNFYLSSITNLETKRGNSIEIKEERIKDHSNFYSLKESSSDLFKEVSLKRYFDDNSSTYGISMSSSKGNDDDFTNYSNYSFLDENQYIDEYSLRLDKFNNLIFTEDKFETTFLSSNKYQHNDKMVFEYELKTYSNSDYNSTYYIEEELLNYFPNFADCSIIDYKIKIALPMSYEELNFEIETTSNLKINSIDLKLSEKSSYKEYKNELPTSFENIQNTIKQDIEDNQNLIKDELYRLYVDLNKKYSSINYYTTTSSLVNALGGIYSQTVKGFKLKDNNNYFFQTVTTSAFVNKAELRYENHDKNEYYLASGNNPSTSSEYGDVSSWNKLENYSEEKYIETIGHFMTNITNYIVDENDYSKSFNDVYLKETDNEVIITYDMSLKDENDKINSVKNYQVEMNHMSNMGLPEFKYSTIDIYLTKDRETINKIVQKEEYKAGSFNCTSEMTTLFNIYNNLNEVPSSIVSTYEKETN